MGFIMRGNSLHKTFIMEEKKFDMEDRFVNYACSVMDIVESLPNTLTGGYLAGQLVRSCNSPAFNYSDVQRSNSRAEFIERFTAILRELKECRTAFKIIRKRNLLKSTDKLDLVFEETEALIAIIGKSVSTAKKNKAKSAAA